MKKIISILISIFIVLSSVNAQEYKNEISLTYGQFTAPQMVYVLGGVFGTAFSLGHFTFDNTIFTGATGVEYYHHINDWFSYGGSIVFDYMTADSYNVDSEGNKTPNGKFKLGWMSVMPSTKFTWLRREVINLYSKISIGPGLIFDNGDSIENNISFGFQATPIGISFGRGSIKGFTELGFGMQGIVNVGIKKLF